MIFGKATRLSENGEKRQKDKNLIKRPEILLQNESTPNNLKQRFGKVIERKPTPKYTRRGRGGRGGERRRRLLTRQNGR